MLLFTRAAVAGSRGTFPACLSLPTLFPEQTDAPACIPHSTAADSLEDGALQIPRQIKQTDLLFFLLWMGRDLGSSQQPLGAFLRKCLFSSRRWEVSGGHGLWSWLPTLQCCCLWCLKLQCCHGAKELLFLFKYLMDCWSPKERTRISLVAHSD